MQLSPHFTMAEFANSDTAVRMGIDNTVPANLLMAAKDTCDMLERIRAFLTARAGREIPIQITSGYRCRDLNVAVGGQPTSDHVRAQAIDFKAPAFGTPYQVCRAIGAQVSELGIGQVIHEYGRWVHVSTRRPDKEINRLITITARGTQAGIQEVA